MFSLTRFIFKVSSYKIFQQLTLPHGVFWRDGGAVLGAWNVCLSNWIKKVNPCVQVTKLHHLPPSSHTTAWPRKADEEKCPALAGCILWRRKSLSTALSTCYYSPPPVSLSLSHTLTFLFRVLGSVPGKAISAVPEWQITILIVFYPLKSLLGEYRKYSGNTEW